MERDQLYIFKKWVYGQLQAYDVTVEGDAHRMIAYAHDRKAVITFWDDIQVIEEEIFAEGALIFYLHYAFHNYKIATDLFQRMMKALMTKRTDDIRRVLICCSGGMTSGYFKMRMNEYVRLNNLPYAFEATAFDDIGLLAEDYDLILIAPQMRYIYHRVHEIAPHAHIEVIDTSIFATYDCAGLLAQIRHYDEGHK